MVDVARHGIFARDFLQNRHFFGASAACEYPHMNSRPHETPRDRGDAPEPHSGLVALARLLARQAAREALAQSHFCESEDPDEEEQ
jgi:hypothetical protein